MSGENIRIGLIVCDFGAHRPALYSFPEARLPELERIWSLIPQPWLIDSDLQTLDRACKKQCTPYFPWYPIRPTFWRGYPFGLPT